MAAPDRKPLSPAQRERGLLRLRDIQREAMFTEHETPELATDLWRWDAFIRSGWIDADELARIEAVSRQLGLE